MKDITIKELVQGYSEAGDNFEDYYYMTEEKFLEEMNMTAEQRRIEQVDWWWRKKSHPRKLIWVVGYGLQM